MSDAFFDHNGREISGLTWLIAGMVCFAAVLMISVGLSHHKNTLERRDWAPRSGPIARPASPPPIAPAAPTPR